MAASTSPAFSTRMPRPPQASAHGAKSGVTPEADAVLGIAEHHLLPHDLPSEALLLMITLIGSS